MCSYSPEEVNVLDVHRDKDWTVKAGKGKGKGNPKDLIANRKVPLQLWPPSATAMGAVGLLEGMLKYGRNNFRSKPVHASVYVAAVLRHLLNWFEGNDLASDSGNHHIGLGLANLAIITEALMVGTLIDDRNYKGSLAYKRLTEELEQRCAVLYRLYGNRKPRHYTRLDEVKHRSLKSRRSGRGRL